MTRPRASGSPPPKVALLPPAALLLALAAELAAAADGTSWSGAIVLVREPEGAWAKAGRGGWPLRIAKPDGAGLAVAEPGKPLRALTAGFSSACDPCVSMDGRRVLFAGKERADGPWDIYEVGADGTGLRRITQDLGDCFEPRYLARGAILAPEYRDKVRWIVFASTAAGNAVEAGGERATSLHVRSLEPIPGRGIVTWRTTYNLSSDFSPTVLADGRVLYSTWQAFPGRHGPAAGAAPRGAVELFTVSWSGEDINVFLPSPKAGLVRSMACETADRWVVFVESDGSRPDRGGRLARVSLRRPSTTYESMSQAPGWYRDPCPLPDGRLAVAYAPGGKRFGIHAFDPSKGGPGERLLDDPEASLTGAAPLVPRPEPLGRITMVDEKAAFATLTCLNVYESDRPEVRALPRGSVRRARFLEGIPAAARAPAGVRVLGEAPVEADGSFLVRVLPEVPFTLELLDAGGAVLARMRTWIWLPRGDERGCIGCHEDRELTPENRVTEALLKGKPWPVLPSPGERPGADLSSRGVPDLTGGSR